MDVRHNPVLTIDSLEGEGTLKMDKQAIENHFRGDFQRFYDHYLPKLQRVKGNEMSAPCPFHDDHTPSLSLNRQTGLFRCFGCETSGDIFNFYAKTHAMILPSDFSKVLAGIARDFAIQNNNGESSVISTITARYDYHDESGTLVYQIERLEPKRFRIRRPDGNGGWIYKKDDVRIIPYRLPDVMKAEEVFIVEGEKDVNSMAKIGFTATTNPFGAGKWPKHFGPYLQGKHVVLIPDNDEMGRAHMKQVAMMLMGHAASVRWLDLPTLNEKEDVSDFIATFSSEDGAAKRLAVMVEGAAEYRNKVTEIPEQGKKQFHFLPANDLCVTPKLTSWLLKPYIDSGSLGMTSSAKQAA